MSVIKNVAKKFVTTGDETNAPGFAELIRQKVEEMKKEVIYQAVSQTDDWITVKCEVIELDIDNLHEYIVLVHCRPVPE